MNNKLPTLTKSLTNQIKCYFAAKELLFGNDARAKML